MKKLILVALVLFSTAVSARTLNASYHAHCEGQLTVFLDEDINDYSDYGNGAYNITTVQGKEIRMSNVSCMFTELE